MNKPKFYYDKDTLVFFTQYQGTKVELLKVKLKDADFEAIKHYRNLAQIELNSFINVMALAKLANKAA